MYLICIDREFRKKNLAVIRELLSLSNSGSFVIFDLHFNYGARLRLYM